MIKREIPGGMVRMECKACRATETSLSGVHSEAFAFMRDHTERGHNVYAVWSGGMEAIYHADAPGVHTGYFTNA